jgi:scyllo-inositol 2-dehydrogenase (NADP+)
MRRAGGFHVTTLVDPDRTRAAATAANLDIPHAYGGTSVDDLPDPSAIDAVTCGTAPFSHAAVIESALQADKHVISEKPFTITVAEGERLAALARERGRILAVVHNFQFARSAVQLQRWVRQGRLGTMRAVWAMQLSNPRRRLPTWVDELPLGLYFDESPHLLYLVRALAGEELQVDYAAVRPSTIGLANTPSHLTIALTGESGVPVTVNMSFEAPVSEWHVALVGADGIGVLDLFRDIAHLIPNDGEHGAAEVLRTSAVATWHHWRGYLNSGPPHLRGNLLYGNDTVFARFRDAVRTGKGPDGIAAHDALAVLRLQHRIVELATEQATVA